MPTSQYQATFQAWISNLTVWLLILGVDNPNLTDQVDLIQDVDHVDLIHMGLIKYIYDRVLSRNTF